MGKGELKGEENLNTYKYIYKKELIIIILILILQLLMGPQFVFKTLFLLFFMLSLLSANTSADLHSWPDGFT